MGTDREQRLADGSVPDLDATQVVGDHLQRPLRGPASTTTSATRDPSPDPGEAAETMDPVGPVDGVESDATATLSGDNSWFDKLGRERLGAYRIVDLLGEGGMGQVYVGEDARLGRQVAVKILPPEMAERAGWLERFEREARALATLNHPNIVTIHSIEKDDEIRFLTMELVRGRTLKQRLAGGALPVDDVLRIGLELSGALAAAHHRGVIHRDLKPANVMITDEGRVKILDFGIAKLSSLGPSQVSRDGQVLGTVAYMAPEQLEGQTVDARADLFSLGLLLFQMATSQHPFPAAQPMQRINAILRKEPLDPLTLRPDLPPELAQIILRCLEKDPQRRYPDAETLRQDLSELREERLAQRIFETRTDLRLENAALVHPAGSRPWLVPILLAALLAAFTLAVVVLRQDPAPPTGTVSHPSGAAETKAPRVPTPLVVVPFQNLTGDPAIEWLSDGIAELLAIDLGQSPGLAVGQKSTDELSHDRGDNPPPSTAPPTLVVKGSYAWLGNVLRIAYSLEDPMTARVVDTASFEGIGDESLFGLVDQLGTAVLASVGASRPELGPATVEEATTSSVSALQVYLEGQHLYLRQSKPEEALALFEQALRIDPDFALASVAAAKIHQSQGRSARAEEYSLHAFERVESLPLRTRFDVELAFYSGRWATLGRAIESYDLGLKVYPDQPGWRNNLARRLAFFERYDEALEEFQRAIDSGVGFWGNFYGAANVHAALGDFETGHRLLEEALAAEPEHWLLRYAMAWHLTEWGRYDEASTLFKALAQERPDSPQIPYGRWRLAVLRDDPDEAQAQAERLLELDDSFARWRGHLSLAQNALYHGLARQALEHFDRAIAASSGADRALARCWKAQLLLVLEENEAALGEARGAQLDGIDQWPELRGFYLAALAHQALGQEGEADHLAELLRERWRRQPNAVEERQILHLDGLLSLARGDTETGRNTLERAVALLPPRGVEFSWHVFPDHVPLLVDLARAELDAGHPNAALGWLGRLAALGSERLEQPVPWVRSLYLRARALDSLGRHDEARESDQTFLDQWSGGDLHRQWLLEARAASPTPEVRK